MRSSHLVALPFLPQPASNPFRTALVNAARGGLLPFSIFTVPFSRPIHAVSCAASDLLPPLSPLLSLPPLSPLVTRHFLLSVVHSPYPIDRNSTRLNSGH